MQALVRKLRSNDDEHAYDVLVKCKHEINDKSHICVVDVIRSSIVMFVVIFGSSSFGQIYLFKFGGSLTLCYLSTLANVPKSPKDTFSFHCLPLAYMKEILVSRKAVLLYIYVASWLDLCNLISELDVSSVLTEANSLTLRTEHVLRYMALSLLLIALRGVNQKEVQKK